MQMLIVQCFTNWQIAEISAAGTTTLQSSLTVQTVRLSNFRWTRCWYSSVRLNSSWALCNSWSLRLLCFSASVSWLLNSVNVVWGETSRVSDVSWKHQTAVSTSFDASADLLQQQRWFQMLSFACWCTHTCCIAIYEHIACTNTAAVSRGRTILVCVLALPPQSFVTVWQPLITVSWRIFQIWHLG